MKTFLAFLATALFAADSLAATTWPPANTKGNAGRILDVVYGSVITECTRDADADTTTANRLGPFTAERIYTVYCHDGAGVGVACECLFGGSSVDNQAASTEGIVLFAGEKWATRVKGGSLYLSCVPYADNQMIDVCPLEY